MNRYEALLKSLRDRKDITGKLLDVEGTKLACHAILVKYTKEVEALLKQLEPENPLAHCLWKPLEKTDLARIQYEIDDIRPNRPLSTNLAQLQESSLPGQGIKLDVDGETFYIHASNLQKYAFAIRCKLDVLARANGTTTQFFIDKEKELALKKAEKGILRCFYNKIFDGHFRLSPTEGWLMLYMDGMEFKQELPQGTRIRRTFCFHCTAGDCNAVVHLACFDDAVRIRYVNHSKQLAHSHSDQPPRETIEDISFKISTQQKGHSPMPINFPDKEFLVDASECYYSSSKLMINEPGTNFTYKSTHPPNVHGVTTFYCSSSSICKCSSKAYEKKIKGKKMMKFGGSHNHAQPLSEPKNRSRLKPDELADDVFTLDLERVPKKMNRKNTKQETVDYLLKNGTYEYNFHGRSVSAKNTTWWCSLGSKCKAKIVKRDINGEPKGYLYTDDHTCDIDEQEQQQDEGESSSGIQMEVDDTAEEEQKLNTEDVEMME